MYKDNLQAALLRIQQLESALHKATGASVKRNKRVVSAKNLRSMCSKTTHFILRLPTRVLEWIVEYGSLIGSLLTVTVVIAFLCALFTAISEHTESAAKCRQTCSKKKQEYTLFVQGRTKLFCVCNVPGEEKYFLHKVRVPQE